MSSTNEDKYVAARIHLVRERKGLSQTEFSGSMGIPLRTYQNYERGDRSASQQLIHALLSTFGVDPVWLLTGQGEMYRQDSKPAAPVTDELAGLLPQLTPAQQRAVLEDVKEKARLNALEIRLQKLEGE
jgi:transcriptional regulator with XRE-family HTH domain